MNTDFTNNGSQNGLQPEDVKKGQIRARGTDRGISPVGHIWDAFFLNGPQASDDFMAERTSQEPSEHASLRGGLVVAGQG